MVTEKPRARPNNKTAVKTKPAKAPQVAESTPRDSAGTGFIVSDKGHVLTNQHVVDRCSTITVSRTGDTAQPATVLRKDVINDLAVLKIDAVPAPDEIARFRARSLRAGETIATYGFPLTGMLSASGNIVSGNVSSLAGVTDDVRLLQISAPVQPGNSGGPLLDMQGAVAGIVSGKLNDLAAAEASGSLPQNVNFSIKANVGMNFLDAHSIPYEMSSETAALDLPAVADKAKKFTVFIAYKG
ncbi:trypsin-like peptidase domain-containing protein [Aestuariivirga sp. YIM B02566]|uniref:Trypsin-like peptidase domain-containing protein n=1 Tax=Taklimakanibacter albus TaxID=2800327 RepID=A0ACC5R732_9HYPH|nr:trypsin-like peptidase domain-containing protein [Aestuariivirga sp. YIM B02566]